MKILFLVLTTVLLSACAVVTPPPATIALGSGKHRVEPPSSAIPGYKSVEFSARLTNSSKHPIWYYAQLPKFPFYRQFVRSSPEARWIDRSHWTCGFGADFHQLAPGASITFTVWVPARDIGSQLRVEIPIHPVPNDQIKPRQVTSPAAPIL